MSKREYFVHHSIWDCRQFGDPALDAPDPRDTLGAFLATTCAPPPPLGQVTSTKACTCEGLWSLVERLQTVPLTLWCSPGDSHLGAKFSGASVTTLRYIKGSYLFDGFCDFFVIILFAPRFDGFEAVSSL